ncbi:MAG: hypothetical protein Q9178_004698 [Gyalolechia marmorata]
MERERRRLPVTLSVPRFFEDTFDSDSDSDGPTTNRSPKSRMRKSLRRTCAFPVTESLEDKTCHICLSTFTSSDRPARLPCGHIFGFSCLTTWSVGRPVPTCPICRAQYIDPVASVTADIRRSGEIIQERSEMFSELNNLYQEERRLHVEQDRLNAEQLNLSRRLTDLRRREWQLRFRSPEQFAARDYLPSSRSTTAHEMPEMPRAEQTSPTPPPSQDAIILEPRASPDIQSLETYLNRPAEEEL